MNKIPPNPLLWPTQEPLQPNPIQTNKSKPVQQNQTPVNFKDILSTALNADTGVKLSVHAEKRLRERNINLNETDWAKINQAVEKAAAKGARESLLLYGDLALITSIHNRIVVTALDGQAMQEHVFTNIDSAVIVK